jgi:hypothetical protein
MIFLFSGSYKNEKKGPSQEEVKILIIDMEWLILHIQNLCKGKKTSVKDFPRAPNSMISHIQSKKLKK